MKKNSLAWALVLSAAIGLVALTGCDASLDSASATGLEDSDGGTIDSRSVVIGDYFDGAVWETDDGGDMANIWDFSVGTGIFDFWHYMDGELRYIGRYKYEYDLSAGILYLTPVDGGPPQGPFTVTQNSANDFTVSPEPLGMGGTHFVKQ